MKLTYSTGADAIYVQFGRRRMVEHSDEVSNVLNIRVVDYSKDGSIVGVEILDTHEGVDVDGLPRAEELAALLAENGFRVIAHQGAA